MSRLSLLFLSFTFYLLTVISPVYAAVPTCDPNIKGDCPAGLTQIEEMFKQFITVFVGFGFVVLLIMLIMAGFKYLTSGGEPKAVSAAHQTFMWALLGIFFMAVAWIILLLIEQFTGVDVTTFNVQTLVKP